MPVGHPVDMSRDCVLSNQSEFMQSEGVRKGRCWGTKTEAVMEASIFQPDWLTDRKQNDWQQPQNILLQNTELFPPEVYNTLSHFT